MTSLVQWIQSVQVIQKANLESDTRMKVQTRVIQTSKKEERGEKEGRRGKREYKRTKKRSQVA